MAVSELNTVNEYCLDNIMRLAETTQVVAAETVFDIHGTKLLAKGAPINLAMKEKLLQHKLRKPLESSLSVVDGVTHQSILAEANRLIGEVPALKVVMGLQQAAILKILSKVSLHPVAALLMTVADNSRPGQMRHGVLVSLVAASLGIHHKLSDDDLVMLALAGLIHDIGLLYTHPDYLHTDRLLKPHEWKHLAVHPLIGQIVLGELAHYPEIVTDAIAAHHERSDGSGYPRQLAGTQLTPLAQILSMAETLSGIFTRQEDVLTRACLAIKCVPGEYPRGLISVFSTLKRNYAGTPLPNGETTPPNAPQSIQVVKTLLDALAECKNIAGHPSLSSDLKGLLDHVEARLTGLRQALKAAGIEQCLVDGHMSTMTQEDSAIFLEIEVIGREIGWRERDIGRDLYLRLGNYPPYAFPIFANLVEILDKPVDSALA